ncbi:RES family NAD+ phosphorylase [Gloeothece verrucosa]|uniref:RES domain protein n=1 Tax=Gloeothece verrucosa (strain PCC 7822) TaxID=497965 RepID=E0UIG7_GLOV7|nr:RES family NAD+ phosphorylase [Gloeothece verrucosa]ADN12161.1 RES domain protein [Gloeothece verrucosa PCC 7822]
MSTTVWRISKQKYAATAFSGIGAKLVGGRWNSKGSSIVYTSATLSLAALETFVHMAIEDAGNLFVAIKADIPDDVSIKLVAEQTLPSNWRDIPAPKILASLGDDWFTSQETAVLKVPSVIIPVEYNYLLNPLHPDFAKITIYPEELFILDPRMWK